MKAKVLELKLQALSSMARLFISQSIGKISFPTPFYQFESKNNTMASDINNDNNDNNDNNKTIESYFSSSKIISRVDKKLIEDLLINDHLNVALNSYKEALQEKLDHVVVKVSSFSFSLFLSSSSPFPSFFSGN
jgi:hypothetical protein